MCNADQAVDGRNAPGNLSHPAGVEELWHDAGVPRGLVPLQSPQPQEMHLAAFSTCLYPSRWFCQTGEKLLVSGEYIQEGFVATPKEYDE